MLYNNVNPHIRENFKAEYSEVVKRYEACGKVFEEKLEFQVVDMDDKCTMVWVRDVSLDRYIRWTMDTQRFLQRIGKIKVVPQLTEQMVLW